jgi:hypothetical protein
MPRAENKPDFSTLIAVAAGRIAVVAGCVAVLRRAGFRLVTADSCTCGGYAEVWVGRDNAETALGLLRASGGGKQLIW